MQKLIQWFRNIFLGEDVEATIRQMQQVLPQCEGSVCHEVDNRINQKG